MVRLFELAFAPRQVGPLSLSLEGGQVVLLCGPSGSGKSTLCALLTGELEPTSGERGLPESVASMTADVEGQLLGGTVAQELALGRGANRRTDEPTELGGVREELVHAFAGREGEDPQTLSAGERQLLLLTSLALGPFSLLLLDEGLSSLDQASFENVCRALRALARAGRLIVVVSHELRMLPWVDRVVGLHEGRLAFDTPASELTWGQLETTRMWLGALASQVAQADVRVLETLNARQGRGRFMPRLFAPPSGVAQPLLAYESQDFALPPGGVLGLAGVAGSGKSRLLATLAGADTLAGWVAAGGGYRVWLPQHAGSIFRRRTVRAELEASLAEGRRRDPDAAPALGDLAEIPEGWRERSPGSLSQGQTKILACLCLLLQGPDLLLLDHPFAALDAHLRGQLERRLADYLGKGGRIVLSTHLPDEMVCYASDLMLLDDFRPVWKGSPEQYFGHNPDPRLGRP